MRYKINLNADLGESFGAWSMGDDSAMLRTVGAANIACGFHAGDPSVMRQTLRLAKKNRVSVGAHPSYPDLQGFGRRRMILAVDELEAMVIYQIAALAGLARTEDIPVSHVKPHGALSNDVCADRALADSVVRAIAAFDRSLILLAPVLSALYAAGEAAGLRVVGEVYADRTYMDDGQLVARCRPGSVLHGPDACFSHVERMLAERAIISINGKKLSCEIGSICVHGDGAEAVTTASHIHNKLTGAGYDLVGLPDL